MKVNTVRTVAARSDMKRDEMTGFPDPDPEPVNSGKTGRYGRSRYSASRGYRTTLWFVCKTRCRGAYHSIKGETGILRVRVHVGGVTQARRVVLANEKLGGGKFGRVGYFSVSRARTLSTIDVVCGGGWSGVTNG
jgi:hypothetical protein